MTVVIVDRSFVPQPGDVHIQNPRPPVGAACIDPQHGGHRRPDPAGEWLDPVAGDAACTFALRVRSLIPEGARIVLPFNVSLDSWVAAACLTLEGEVSDEAVQRAAALAAADGVEHHAALGEWTPGTVLPTVGDDARFSGLARLCAAPVTLESKLAALREWITAGTVSIGPFSGADIRGLRAAGVTTEDCTMQPADLLPVLTDLALAEREASKAACSVSLLDAAGQPVDLVHAETQALQQFPSGATVALVTSQMSGLSAGRAAFTVGYRLAPVVVCCSPLGDPRVPEAQRGPLFTIGRAANARSVAFPFAAICAALNAAEVQELSMRGYSVTGLLPDESGRVASGWGGNPQSGVLGSPKPLAGWQGSILAPEKVAEIVAQTCAAAR